MKPNGLLYPLLVSALAVPAFATAADNTDPQTRARGGYLLVASGCNDCHTAGYMQSEGKVPEADRLTGSSVGFQGPWGTTHPANLRLYMQNLTETQWLARARQPMRPPMPWFNLRAMTDDDLRAMYHYIRALGPAGEPAPAAVPPGVAITTPYIDFTPRNLPLQALQGQR